MWFQNRRAKFRKKENTRKGPGRPSHNAQLKTCSGEPLSQEELERREQERSKKKAKKPTKKSPEGSTPDERGENMTDSFNNSEEAEIDVVGEGNSDFTSPSSNDLSSDAPRDSSSPEQEVIEEVKPPVIAHRSSFSIDSILETPKVPRGRRPNSKYPRVQASKTMTKLNIPFYAVTQPVGFEVERMSDSHSGDHVIRDANLYGGHSSSTVTTIKQESVSDNKENQLGCTTEQKQ